MSLQTQRAMCQDNAKNHTVECPIGIWFEHALDSPNDPRWSAGASTRLKQSLIERKEITSAGWASWAGAIRDFGALHEDDLYKNVETISGKICEAALSLGNDLYRAPGAVFQTTPTKSSQSDVKLPLHKPDGRLSLLRDGNDMTKRQLRHPRRAHQAPKYYNETEKLVSTQTSRCAGLAEFKKRLKDAHENDRQLLSGANHLIFNDPHRRFLLAITIEKTSTRVWRFDRGMILVSERFDFQTDPEYLIRIMLYFSYASNMQLGFDPTVDIAYEPLNNKKLVDYIYQVQGKYYRTVDDPLAEHHASLLISRGIRVWAVKECDRRGIVKEGAKKMVLKDIWMWEGSSNEKQIQDKIFEALKTLDDKKPILNSSRVDQMKQFFLTIKEVDIVRIGETNDITVRKPANASQIPFAMSLPLPPSTAQGTTAHRESQHNLPAASHSRHSGEVMANRENLQHHRRVHMRYVVEELCTTIYDTSNIKVALQAIASLTTALDLLRQANFMHRDISGGNCMIYTDPDTGEHHAKLADLELCKSYDATDRAHDPVSGTLEFLPVEANPWDPRFRFMGKNPSKWDIVSLRAARAQVKNSKEFFWHLYHDLESLYWLFVWYIMSWFPSAPGTASVTGEQFTAWSTRLELLFNPNDAGMFLAKLDLLRDPADLALDMTDAWGWPEQVATAYIEPLQFGNTLQTLYEDIQRKPWDQARKWPAELFTEEPYQAFMHALQDVLNNWDSWDAVVMRSLQPPLGEKRKADDDEDGGVLDDPAVHLADRPHVRARRRV